jgi:serine/threonine protein kinase/HAMP domain-containing protein
MAGKPTHGTPAPAPQDDGDQTVVKSAQPVPESSHDPDATVVKPVAQMSQYARTVPMDLLRADGSLDDDSTRIDGTWPTAAQADPAGDATITPHGPRPMPGVGTLELPVGFRLFEYRIDRLLGKGGFGLTYLATDVNLNTRFAIKEYLPEQFAFRKSTKTVSASSITDRDRYQQGLDNFLAEARTLATFRHPNIVRVARFFEANKTAYIVLEYEKGDALRSWWRRNNQLPERDLVQLLQPLLEGLSVVHAAGFLHRDIKPDNIYVRQEDGSLVLLDFGSARQAVGGEDVMGHALTPGYAPIEQYEDASQGAYTDIYGLAATLYWLVTGTKPPIAPERVVADKMVPALQAGQGRYTPQFLQAIDWGLKPQPQDRPQDIAQFAGALFAAHGATLGLQEALRLGDTDTVVTHSWRTVLSSPRQWPARMARRWRDLVEPASWPLSVKMTVAMVLAALVPMLATGYYNLRASLEMVSTSELRNLEQLARSTAGRVAQLIGDSENLARALGTDTDFVNVLRNPTDEAKETIRAKLVSVVQSNADIHLLMVMDTEGTAIVSSDPEVMGKNFKFRAYFKSAMEGKPFVTGIVVGAVAGAAGMFYSYPVYDDAERVIGAVVMRIKASSFAAILEDVRNDSRRTPFLVDGDGVVIYHPLASVLYSSLVPLKPDRLAAIRADQRFRRNDIASLNMPDLAAAMVGAKARGNIGYNSSVTKVPEIAGFAPVRGHDWVVGVTESREDFEQPLNKLFTNLQWSLLLMGLLFTGLALRFARSIARPVEALTAAAHALKSGDYAKANITVKTRDEIGQLARTFNVLIDVLRQRERERQRLAKRGSDASKKIR